MTPEPQAGLKSQTTLKSRSVYMAILLYILHFVLHNDFTVVAF